MCTMSVISEELWFWSYNVNSHKYIERVYTIEKATGMKTGLHFV